MTLGEEKTEGILTGTATLAAVPVSAAMAPAYVLADCGELKLLFPHGDLVSLVAAQTLVAQPQTELDCGYIDFKQQRFTIFSINRALQLLPTVSAEQSTILLLRHESYCFGLSCLDVVKQSAPPSLIFSVPPSMQSRKQPFTEFTLQQNCAVGISSAAEVLALLRLRGAKLTAYTATNSELQGAG
jgi:hypothetical protein